MTSGALPGYPRPMLQLLAHWVVSAIVLMASVALVTPKNPDNRLGRALLVTFVIALLSPLTSWLGWVLIVPALVGLVLWFLVYTFAYGIGALQAIAIGIVQSVLGYAVDLALRAR